MKKGLRLLQEGCPIEIKAVHVLNTFPFVNVIMGKLTESVVFFRPMLMKLDPLLLLFFIFSLSSLAAMIKPFASSGLLSKVSWHPPGTSFEAFHKIIPKQCLPSDYDGDLESITELSERHKKFMSQNNEYFILEEEQMNFKF